MRSLDFCGHCNKYMLVYLCTLTDHSSIIMGVTVASVNEVAMDAAEQVCLGTSTLDTTHSGRLGEIIE